MGAPQIIVIVLLALILGMALAKDGKPKGNWSFFGQLFGAVIHVGLLYWGGFFS
jgi:hypothetical protein